jgi:hypothetical protein
VRPSLTGTGFPCIRERGLLALKNLARPQAFRPSLPPATSLKLAPYHCHAFTKC